MPCICPSQLRVSFRLPLKPRGQGTGSSAQLQQEASPRQWPKARCSKAARNKVVVGRTLPPCGASACGSTPLALKPSLTTATSIRFPNLECPLLFSALSTPKASWLRNVPLRPLPRVLTSSNSPAILKDLYSPWSSHDCIRLLSPSWAKGEPGGLSPSPHPESLLQSLSSYLRPGHLVYQWSVVCLYCHILWTKPVAGSSGPFDGLGQGG